MDKCVANLVAMFRVFRHAPFNELKALVEKELTKWWVTGVGPGALFSYGCHFGCHVVVI